MIVLKGHTENVSKNKDEDGKPRLRHLRAESHLERAFDTQLSVPSHLQQT